MRPWARGLPVVVLASAPLVACGDRTDRSEACLPGDYVLGTLPDGGAGFLLCGANGETYLYGVAPPSPVVDAAIPVDAAVPVDAAATTSSCTPAAGQKLGFMCAGCQGDDDCAPGLVCFPFPNKGGNLCTRSCTTTNAAQVCTAPSVGCGNNGHCKP